MTLCRLASGGEAERPGKNPDLHGITAASRLVPSGMANENGKVDSAGLWSFTPLRPLIRRIRFPLLVPAIRRELVKMAAAFELLTPDGVYPVRSYGTIRNPVSIRR